MTSLSLRWNIPQTEAELPRMPILRGSLSRDLGTTKIIVVNVDSDVALLLQDFEFVFAPS
jgi:hypothetical protein